MNEALKSKVLEILGTLPSVEEQLGLQEVISDPKKFKEVSQRYSYLTKLSGLYAALEKNLSQVEDGKEMLKEIATSDPEMAQEISEEIATLQGQLEEQERSLQEALIPPSSKDHANTILELRAGTGGDEAALFVGDCVRMYSFFASSMQWKCEVLEATASDMGGYKECILSLSGSNVFKILQYEAGTHRVQRVPATESQGRVHTSAITCAVMAEPDEEEEIQIDEKEIRIDTMRSSGAGGQHVNTTDSAVRITHLPSQIVVYCQQERSQIKNREKAMRLLHAKLADRAKQEREAQESQLRASQVGSGDRSERIRTYNFPQNRVTDHRINLTLYSLDKVMDGEMTPLTSPLVLHFRQQELASL